ncbi:MAG: hypothetical protein FWD92_02210 [Methanomassiliicoccaceae archaeon]|nr:hypothetical protein [Methanomassiliicoccaceae archaeon]
MSEPPKLTDNEIWIFAELINTENTKAPRTAQQVAEITGFSKQYVSKTIKKLSNLKIISPLSGYRTDKLYDTGRYGNRVKGMVDQSVIDALRLQRKVDSTGVHPSPTVESPPAHLYNVPMVMGAHFPYTQARFKVIAEGNIEYTNEMAVEVKEGHVVRFLKIGDSPKEKDIKRLKFPVFGENARSREALKNQDNFEAHFSVDGEKFKIRYQRTYPKKGAPKRLFYVDPLEDPEFLLSDITSDEDVGMKIIAKCRRVLYFLQKYAGWTFDDKPLNDIKRYHLYSKNKELNAWVESEVGRKVMESEGYKFWFDESHRPSGHLESKSLAFFKALDKLAEIRADIEEAKVAINEHEVRITDSEREILSMTANIESNQKKIQEIKAYVISELIDVWKTIEEAVLVQKASFKTTALMVKPLETFAGSDAEGGMYG